MKILIIVTLIFLLTGSVFAQKGVKVQGNSVSTKEIAPTWPGCSEVELSSKDCFNKKMSLHIKENFKYPRDKQGNLIRGKSTVSFFIDKKGAVGNVTAEGPHKAINEEAVRIVKLFPKMSPGMRGGKPISVKYKMPFNF